MESDARYNADLYPAKWNDGKSDKDRNATVSIIENALHIYTEDGKVVGRWALPGLLLVKQLPDDEAIYLKHKDHQEQSLSFDDYDLYSAITARQPVLRRWRKRNTSSAQRLAVFSTVMVSVVVGMVASLPYFAKQVAAILPASLETKLGNSITPLSPVMTCASPEGQAVLDKLMKQLSVASGSHYQFKANVIHDASINTYALPGGQIIIHGGLLQQASNGTEVAAVIAHEMAHVMQHHPAEGAIREMDTSMIINSLFGDADASKHKLGHSMAALSHGAAAEVKTDLMGIKILDKAGIRSNGLLPFFKKLHRAGKQKNSKPMPYNENHPASNERLHGIHTNANAKQPIAMNHDDWLTLKAICQ